MNHRHLIRGIAAVAGGSRSVADALRRMEVLLSEDLGSVVLTIKPAGEALLSGVAGFLESSEYPFRSVFTERVVSAKADLENATLVACFGTWGAPSQFLRDVTAEAARQIGRRADRLPELTHAEAA